MVLKTRKIICKILIVLLMLSIVGFYDVNLEANTAYAEDTTITINVDVDMAEYIGLANIVNEDMDIEAEYNAYATTVTPNSDGKSYDVNITGPWDSDKPYYIYLGARKDYIQYDKDGFKEDAWGNLFLLLATYENGVLDKDHFVLSSLYEGKSKYDEDILEGYKKFKYDEYDQIVARNNDDYAPQTLWMYRQIGDKWHFIYDVRMLVRDEWHAFIPQLPEGEKYFYQYNAYLMSPYPDQYTFQDSRFSVYFDDEEAQEYFKKNGKTTASLPQVTFVPDKEDGKIVAFRPERKDDVKSNGFYFRPFFAGYYGSASSMPLWSCCWQRNYNDPYTACLNAGEYDRFVFLVRSDSIEEPEEVVLEGIEITEDCEIQVPIPDGPVTLLSIQLDEEKYEVNVDETCPTRVFASYSDGTSETVTEGVSFESANLSIASIDSNGVITGIEEGTTTITATLDGETCEALVEVSDVPRVHITPEYPLTEENLDGAEITLILSKEQFKDDVLDPDNFTLYNLPPGAEMNTIQYISPTEAVLLLEFDGTDFDCDIEGFDIEVDGKELANENDLTSNELYIEASRDLIQFSSPSYSCNEGDGTTRIRVDYIYEDESEDNNGDDNTGGGDNGNGDDEHRTDSAIKYEMSSATDYRTGGAIEEFEVIVEYYLDGGSAIENVDYSGDMTGTLVFDEETDRKRFEIEIIDDSIKEGNETVLMSLDFYEPLTRVEFGIDTATLVIQDNDKSSGSSGGGSSGSSSTKEEAPKGDLINRMPGHKDISDGKKISGIQKEIKMNYNKNFFKENPQYTPRIYYWNESVKKWVALATYIGEDGEVKGINNGEYKGWFRVFAVLQPEFIDISTHWGEDTADRMNGLAMVEGYEKRGVNRRELKPEQNITRAEFSMLVYRLLNINLDDVTLKALEENEVNNILKTNFEDYENIPKWVRQEAAALAKAEILSSRDGKCEANQPITRIEAALMVSNALKLLDKFEPADFSEFKDGNEIENCDEICQDVLTGYPDGTIKPEDFIKRIEALTLLERLFVNGMGW